VKFKRGAIDRYMSRKSQPNKQGIDKMTRPAVLRTGINDRACGTGALVAHKGKHLTLRLIDIAHLKRLGKQHISTICAARNGNKQAIQSLQTLDDSLETDLLRDYYAKDRLFLEESQPKIKLVKTDNLHGVKDGFTTGLSEEMEVFYRVVYLESEYNISSGCPQVFREAAKEFIYVNYLAIAWQLFRHLQSRSTVHEPLTGSPREILSKLFKHHGIRSILDIGCGSTPHFLKQIYPFCQENGVKLFGINKGELTDENVPKEISLVSGDAQKLNKYFPGKQFDIIVCSGVLGRTVRFLYGNLRAETAAEEMVRSSINALSDNQAAAMFIQTFSSYLLLDRSKLRTRILFWNTDETHQRPETNLARTNEFIKNNCLGDRVAGARLGYLWRQGATVAVLSREE